MSSLRSFLRRLLRWLAELLGLRDDDEPPEELGAPIPALLTLETDDMDLKATVTWPTLRTGGRPLALDEIDRAQLFLGVRDEDEWYAPWGPAVVPVAGELSFERTQTEIDAGEWFVRVVVTDKNGKSSLITGSAVVGGELSGPQPAGLTLEVVE